jgi:chemotaxis protein MotA
LIGGTLLIIYGTWSSGGNFAYFYLNGASWAITAGGTFGTVLVGNKRETVRAFFKIAAHVLFIPKIDHTEIINTLVTFSEKARREGLLALEDDLDELKDPFLRKGIQLVVDGTDPELVRRILSQELDYMSIRHVTCQQMFDDIGTLAPAYGMLGTLIGLIAMLTHMDDKSVVVNGLAIALITSLYGSIIANNFAIPMANKMRRRHDEEQLARECMIEGVLSIQAGDNPRIVKEKLLAFLAPKDRVELEEEAPEK